MPKLAVISGAKCVKVLLKFGFRIEVQQGSHIILTRQVPKKHLSVPNHRELDMRYVMRHYSSSWFDGRGVYGTIVVR